MPQTIRIDKWLFHARFCRTRALAQKKARAGAIRINGLRVEKPSATVVSGDVVTIAIGKEVFVVRVLELGLRRGSASEAQLLFETVPEDA